MKNDISTVSGGNTRGVTVSLIDTFLDKKMIGFKDGMLLTARFKPHREYFETLKKELNTKSTTVFEDEFDITSLGVKDNDLDFIGFDDDGNSYWNVVLGMKPEDRAVLVCSKYGEALDCFYNRIKWSRIAVAPDGEVYFLYYDEKGTHIYKTTRRW
ncbi:MAG: hypothetical protein JW881_17780 [Spirochaetales bacterium]|nr:hypothetical protein [Spirochaetales bacterium]